MMLCHIDYFSNKIYCKNEEYSILGLTLFMIIF